MAVAPPVSSRSAVCNASGLAALLTALEQRGYSLVGPRVVGSAISYQPIAGVDDLPRGWATEQSPGQYRLKRWADEALFAFGPAVESLKRYVLPPVETLWVARREQGTLRFEPEAPAPPRLAVVGVRACELEALARLDDVLLHGPFVDAGYQARRASLFLVAANCAHPADTCFCASMSTGPRARAGYDLALTELGDGRFVVDVGTAAGAAVLATVACDEACEADLAAARERLDRAASGMTKRLDRDGLGAHLAGALEHSAWDEVAHRCLACGNCTMVCPTCFCHTVDDLTDLAGERLERRRRWDTCFTGEFSYIHGGSIRPSVRARYRQWLTHKFSSWAQQFGADGCVGCGRCITWCPAGIDVVVELQRLRGETCSQ